LGASVSFELLSVIRRVLFADDLDPVFHVPNGHQRAVGELMIAADTTASGRGRCIGFAEFCRRLDTDRDYAAWFKRIEAGITAYAHHPKQGAHHPKQGAHHPKQGANHLTQLDTRLSDLIEFPDPDRFPLRHEERSRYQPQEPA
jgi:hypothetical protein